MSPWYCPAIERDPLERIIVTVGPFVWSWNLLVLPLELGLGFGFPVELGLLLGLELKVVAAAFPPELLPELAIAEGTRGGLVGMQLLFSRFNGQEGRRDCQVRVSTRADEGTLTSGACDFVDGSGESSGVEVGTEAEAEAEAEAGTGRLSKQVKFMEKRYRKVTDELWRVLDKKKAHANMVQVREGSCAGLRAGVRQVVRDFVSDYPEHLIHTHWMLEEIASYLLASLPDICTRDSAFAFGSGVGFEGKSESGSGAGPDSDFRPFLEDHDVRSHRTTETVVHWKWCVHFRIPSKMDLKREIQARGIRHDMSIAAYSNANPEMSSICIYCVTEDRERGWYFRDYGPYSVVQGLSRQSKEPQPILLKPERGFDALQIGFYTLGKTGEHKSQYQINSPGKINQMLMLWWPSNDNEFTEGEDVEIARAVDSMIAQYVLEENQELK